jgi:hypothetical protein
LAGFVCVRKLTMRLPNCNENLSATEIRSLFVHPKWRKYGLAVVLIAEVDRTIRKFKIGQYGVYTASFPITQPVCKAKYFKRALDLPVLMECGVWDLPSGFSITRELVRISNFSIPNSSLFEFRRMKVEDHEIVLNLLNKHQRNFKMYHYFDNLEFEYYFTNEKTKVESFVVVNQEKKVVGFTSFYSLSGLFPRVKDKKLIEIRAAFNLYNFVEEGLEWDQLIGFSLLEAKKNGNHIYMMLDMAKNFNALHSPHLFFQPSEEQLNYFVYNWKCSKLDNNDFSLNFI